MVSNLNGPPTIIYPGGPGPLNLIFVNQFKWAPTIIFKWVPNNNIDSGGPGPFNLMFAKQFEWTPYNNI